MFILAETRTTWHARRYEALQNLKGVNEITLGLRVESRGPSAVVGVALMVAPLYGSVYP